jgi:G3E family GTPase
MTEATPVSVITGFLGSGKTTLMRRLLRDPAMGRTAVIINEFGEIGIDHDLIESSDENFIELTTGCLCCKVRSDLVMTLRDMARRRAAGELPLFERVLIETSGLADPAAILQALMIDRDLAGLYVLGVVVTTVDSVLGLDTLARHRQSARQVQVADRILLTKGDLAPPAAGLLDRLDRLNPGARRFQVQQGEIAAATLFDGEAGAAPASASCPSQLETWRRAEPRNAGLCLCLAVWGRRLVRGAGGRPLGTDCLIGRRPLEYRC